MRLFQASSIHEILANHMVPGMELWNCEEPFFLFIQFIFSCTIQTGQSYFSNFSLVNSIRIKWTRADGCRVPLTFCLQSFTSWSALKTLFLNGGNDICNTVPMFIEKQKNPLIKFTWWRFESQALNVQTSDYTRICFGKQVQKSEKIIIFDNGWSIFIIFIWRFNKVQRIPNEIQFFPCDNRFPCMETHGIVFIILFHVKHGIQTSFTAYWENF